MYAPAPDDEITTLVGYLQQQLDALRAAALGLTDEQMTMTPCRSALSILGLIKHAARGLNGATTRLTGDPDRPPTLDAAAFAGHAASFGLVEGESVSDVLRDFDNARRKFVTAARSTDPDGPMTAPPAPWSGVMESRPSRWRYLLVHLVEECARHAGHADIIREQLDGESVPRLVMTVDRTPPNEFFAPYQPAPGTIGGKQAASS